MIIAFIQQPNAGKGRSTNHGNPNCKLPSAKRI